MASVSEENYNPEKYLLDRLNDLGIGFVKVSNDGVILKHNLTFNKIFGYDPEKSLIGTKTLDYWLNPGESNKFIEILLKNGIVKNHIAPAKNVDGEKFFLELNFKLNKNSNGEIISSEGTFVDVTERIETEQKLKESEAKLSTAIESLPFPFFMVDKSGRYIMQNTNAKKTWGNLIGKTPKDIAKDEKTLLLWLSNNSRVFSGETIASEAEYDINGESRYFYDILAPVYVDDKIQNILGVNIDITEKRLAEQKLKESEEKYRTLFESSIDGIVMTDVEGRILDCNEKYSNMVGYTTEELKELTYQQLTPKKWHEWEVEIVQSQFIARGYSDEFEKEYIKKDGTVFPVALKGWVIKDENGNPTGMWGFVRDITERKKAEQKLKESEEKYRELLEDIQEGYYTLDLKGNYTYVNDYWCKTVGYSKEELLGNNYHLIFDEKTSKELFKMFNQLYKSGIPLPHTNRAEGLTNRGKQVFLEGIIDLIYDSEGNKIGFYGFARDITEKIISEQKIKESEVNYKILSNELETILDLIPGMLFCKDINDVITRINQNFAVLLNSKKEDIIGKTTFDLFPKDQAEDFRKDDLEVINTGKPKLNIEEVADFPDKKIWSTTSKVPYYNDKGEINGIIGLAIDISERKKIEQELKESEEKYSNLFQYSNDAIIIHDFEGHILEVNDRAIELFKYPKEEFLALTTPMLRTIEEQEKGEKVSEEISKKGFVRFEFYFKRKDGTVFPAEVSSRAIEIQGEKSIQAVIRDITDRKDSEERLKIFMESAPNTFMLYDSDLNLIDINKIGIKRFPAGTKKEDIIGKNIVELSPDVKKKGRYDEYMKVINTGKPFFVEEFIPHPKFGTLHISLSAFKVLNGLGIIARDITERKKTEQKLKESEERYRVLSENSTDLICVLNEKFEFDYVNEVSLHRMSGYEKKDIIGKKAIIFLHPDDISLLMKAFRKKSDRTHIPIQIRLKHKNGNYIWTEINGSLFHDASGKLRILINIRNITEKKVNEQKLKESEEKFRTLFDIAPASIIVSDLESNILLCNQKFCKLHGVKKPELVIGRKIQEFIAKKDLPILSKVMKKTLNGIHRDPIEYTMLKEDGTEFQVEATSTGIRDKNGKIIGLIGVAQDITWRKQAEQKLKESEKKLKIIFENANDAISIHDLKGNFYMVNKTYCERLGYTKEELLKLTPKDLNTPEYADLVVSRVLEVKEKGFGFFEGAHKTKDGRVIPVEISARRIHYDNKLSILSVVRDITERKKWEEKILEERNKAQSYLDLAGAIIIALDKNGNISMINKKGCEVLGYLEEELIGKQWFKNFLPPRFCEPVFKDFKRLLRGELEPIEFYENPILTKNGEERIIAWHNSLLYDKEESIIGTLTSGEDITDRKEKEKEIFDLAQFPSEAPYPILRVNRDGVIYINDAGQELLNIEDYSQIPNILQENVKNTLESNQIIESEVELDGRIYSFAIRPVKDQNYLNIYGMDITERKLVEENLKEVNKLKSEFLRRASHELKTPIISIKGFSELILALHEDQLDTPIISKLKEINAGCERLQNIINNLLKASRLESPELKPKIQTEDLSFLIKFCVHELESLAVRRNQSIKIDILNDLYANIEKEEIHDVLSNLLTNAIKYTPPMGKIEIKTELREDSVVVSISDNGIGFTEEQKTKIFQQFGKIERYGQGLDLGIDGTGLGLYISKRIVESHGGKIWMESEGKSRGSTFYFTLPTVK